MGFSTLFIIIVLAIVAIVVLKHFADQKKQQKAEVARIASKANEYLRKVNSLKTTSSKLKNCEKALDALYTAGAYKECRDVIENYDELILKIETIKKVLPVGDSLDKAKKHNFKQKESSEKNALLDALYEIRTNNITNQDFDIAELHDENSGEIVTVELIEDRLQELGWTENG